MKYCDLALFDVDGDNQHNTDLFLISNISYGSRHDFEEYQDSLYTSMILYKLHIGLDFDNDEELRIALIHILAMLTLHDIPVRDNDDTEDLDIVVHYNRVYVTNIRKLYGDGSYNIFCKLRMFDGKCLFIDDLLMNIINDYDGNSKFVSFIREHLKNSEHKSIRFDYSTLQSYAKAYVNMCNVFESP